MNKKLYSDIQRNSKVYLNTKSPLNLISPRYFENAASGCLIISEQNKELKKILPKASYIEFSDDLSNFDQVLNKSLDNFNSLKKKRKDAAELIKKLHTWNVRAKSVLKVIKNYNK